MSPLSSTGDKPGGPYRKPRADVFTMLLLIALVALILGMVCLYAEMEDYEWKFKGGPTVTMVVPAESTGYVECHCLPTAHCPLTGAGSSCDPPWASASGYHLFPLPTALCLLPTAL